MRYDRGVPYRENEDAALARADALQSDLDRAETELTTTRARLADAERARDQLIRERDAHVRTSEMLEGMRSPARWDFRRNVLPLILVAGGAVLLILLVSARQAAREADQHGGGPRVRDLPAALRPRHAAPVHHPHRARGCDARRDRTGSRAARARRHADVVRALPGDGVVEARLDGYAPVTVVAEPDASGACSATYPLHEQ